jgi:hypothetical protein
VAKRATSKGEVLPPIRCTGEQRREIERLATAAGVSVSAFARERLLSEVVLDLGFLTQVAQLRPDLEPAIREMLSLRRAMQAATPPASWGVARAPKARRRRRGAD